MKMTMKHLIKAVRGNYRKAVDTGRQSDGGRVVATFYELCQEIWAGSPATESIASGVESSCYTNNDDYNEPIDFNPVMRGTMKQNFQKPKHKKKGLSCWNACVQMKEFNCWKTIPTKKETPKVGPRDTKRCRHF